MLSGVAVINAQHNLMDTVLLDEVTHYGELRKFQSGVKIESIKPDRIETAREGGIENILMRFTPVYIKTDAGGLSTIHFRGTSPSHTTINFGGLNINSLTLGQSNLSTIPTFLFDQIQIQYGSSSAVNGTGAIGGALFLGLSNNWTNGLKINIKSTAGSFGEFLNGAKIYAGNSKLESVSRLYFYQKENNFPFDNPYTGDVENKGVFRDVQKGASLVSKGFLQEINYKFSSEKYLKSSVWVENNRRQVQPNMQTNYVFSGTEELENNNLRFWTEFNNNTNKLKYKTGLGFVHDKQVYDNNELQIIKTNRLVSELQVEYDLSKKAGFRAGAKYRFIKPDVYAYADSVIDFENHLDIYLSSFFQISGNLRMTLNMRQAFVSNFNAPFTPSVGVEYDRMISNYSLLKLNASASGSYRVPTFNDRYWGTQGNPNLKPESGRNFEFGGQYVYEKGKWVSDFKINAFYMDVKNWIEWRNFGVWMAQNVQEVVSKGIELHSDNSLRKGELVGSLILNYTFNPVQAVKSVSETVLLNRQMNYVPRHMGNISFVANFRKWRFFSDATYTGSRFTDDFGFRLDPYVLVNSGIVYRFELNKHQFGLAFSSKNILDKNYQNERYYAMPGRSFQMSVNYNIQLTK